MALTRVQKKGRIDGLSPHQDSRVIDQFMDDVIQFINCVVLDDSGGATGAVATSSLQIIRNVTASFTVLSGQTALQRNPILAANVQITIDSGGELYLL